MTLSVFGLGSWEDNSHAGEQVRQGEAGKMGSRLGCGQGDPKQAPMQNELGLSE